MFEFVTENWVQIIAALTAVVGAARAIVLVTPTPRDDEFLAKVIAALKVIGLHVK